MAAVRLRSELALGRDRGSGGVSVATAEAGCVETPRFSAAAVLERIASLKKDYEEQMVAVRPPTRSGLLPRPSAPFKRRSRIRASQPRRTIQKLATRYASVFRLRPGLSPSAEMRQAVVPG